MPNGIIPASVPNTLTFRDMLMLIAFGHASPERVSAWCAEQPMFARWLKAEAKRSRKVAESLSAATA